MQPVSAVFFLFLAGYFEQIMPQAHGPAHQKNKCFCCAPSFWKGRSDKSNSQRQAQKKTQNNHKHSVELAPIIDAEKEEKEGGAPVARSSTWGVRVDGKSGGGAGIASFNNNNGSSRNGNGNGTAEGGVYLGIDVQKLVMEVGRSGVCYRIVGNEIWLFWFAHGLSFRPFFFLYLSIKTLSLSLSPLMTLLYYYSSPLPLRSFCP